MIYQIKLFIVYIEGEKNERTSLHCIWFMFFIFILGKLLITIIPGNEIANAILFLAATIIAAMYYFHKQKLN